MPGKKVQPTDASEEFIKCRLTITSIKKEKIKNPYLLTVTMKFESNKVLEESGQILKGKVTFEKVTPEGFMDLKKHFGGMSAHTPLSAHFRRIPGACLSDYEVDAPEKGEPERIDD